MFTLEAGERYKYTSVDPEKVTHTLPTGVYRFEQYIDGWGLAPSHFGAAEIVNLDTPVARAVLREVNDFFDADITKRLSDAGIKHRRGIILHGAAGSGKTTLIRSLIPLILSRRAVVLVETNADHLEPAIIPGIRRSDPDVPIVLIWDEFEKNAMHSRNELLRLLDGFASPDHLLTIGATNEIDKIPEQLKNRPSRFSLVLEMPPLDINARKSYVQKKYGMLDKHTMFSLVELTLDKSVDYLEEACKLSLMGYDFDEVRDRVMGVKRLALTVANVEEDDDEEYEDDEEEEEEE